MSDEVAGLLREMIANQREAIGLQREHMALYMKQLERVERINDRAEALQAFAGKTQNRVLWVAGVLLLAVVAIMFWPYMRYLLWWFTER